jgi:hypothetical protein
MRLVADSRLNLLTNSASSSIICTGTELSLTFDVFEHIGEEINL